MHRLNRFPRLHREAEGEESRELQRRGQRDGRSESLPSTALSFRLLALEEHHIKRKKSLSIPGGCATCVGSTWD